LRTVHLCKGAGNLLLTEIAVDLSLRATRSIGCAILCARAKGWAAVEGVDAVAVLKPDAAEHHLDAAGLAAHLADDVLGEGADLINKLGRLTIDPFTVDVVLVDFGCESTLADSGEHTLIQ